jgi:hypothetical protein
MIDNQATSKRGTTTRGSGLVVAYTPGLALISAALLLYARLLEASPTLEASRAHQTRL